MQALTVLPSIDYWHCSCAVPQLGIKLCSCSSSSKWGRDRRKGVNLFHSNCRGVFPSSSYSRCFRSGANLISPNCKSKRGLFSMSPRGTDDLLSMQKNRPFGPAFSLTNDILESKDGVEFAHLCVDDDNEPNSAHSDKYECENDGGGTGHNNNEAKVRQKDGIDRGENDRSGTRMRIDVRMLGWSLSSAKTAVDVEEVLKGKGIFPLQVYSTIIIAFGKEKRMESAMALFKWLKRESKNDGSPLKPNIYIYNNLLAAMKQTGNFDAVEEVINDMATEGVLPNVLTYNTLMSIYIEQGKEIEALQLFEEMPTKCVSPSPASYATVLFAYRRLEDGFGALKFFVEVRNRYKNGELRTDGEEDWDYEFARLENFTIRICYQVMKRWLAARENLGENLSTKVLRLLKDMDKAELKHGRAELECLIWACTREEHYIVSKELYTRIRELDTDISVSVCNHVIWLLGKAKKWWAALEIYEDLLGEGPKPNNISHELVVSHFNVLLTAAQKKGIWRWGVRLLNNMEEKGLKPGSREWNSVLIACSKASETTAAIQIFKRMVEQGEKPTIISYGALLSALEKGKLYNEALQVWKHMMKVGIEPNLYAYTIMVSIYASQGKFDMVDSILREMISVDVEPTVVTFNAIISSCARTNQGGMAYEWFQRMKLENITPNEVTYEMLIEALAYDGQPSIAYELHLRAHSEGLVLSSKAYDAVIQSSQRYSVTIDGSALGPRPPERKKKLQIRKHLSEFCKLADVPRRSKPFEKQEIFRS